MKSIYVTTTHDRSRIYYVIVLYVPVFVTGGAGVGAGSSPTSWAGVSHIGTSHSSKSLFEDGSAM